MEQTLVFSKTTAGTVVFKAAADEDSLWGLTRSFYLNKVALGRDAKTPSAIKVTIEIVSEFDETPTA